MKKITKKDLVGFSLEEMLTKEYGKKGTKKRKSADKRIKKSMKKLRNK